MPMTEAKRSSSSQRSSNRRPRVQPGRDKRTHWGSRSAKSRRVVLDRIALTVVLLTLWEALTRLDALPERYIPPVTRIAPELITEIQASEFWSAIGNTVIVWWIGLVFAVVIGVPVGILMGASSTFESAAGFTVEFLRPVPPVALIPLVVLVTGSGYRSGIFLAAFAAVWAVLIQSLYGARAVDQVAQDTARSFLVPTIRRFRLLTLPTAAPFIATGIRIASSISLILTITAGIVIGSPGLGFQITLAAQAGVYPSMYVLIFVCGVLGYLGNTVLIAAERRLLVWLPENRGD